MWDRKRNDLATSGKSGFAGIVQDILESHL